LIAWLITIAATELISWSVPGCHTGFKASRINCGWATTVVDLLSGISFFLYLMQTLVVACLCLGALLWIIPAYSGHAKSADNRAAPLIWIVIFVGGAWFYAWVVLGYPPDWQLLPLFGLVVGVLVAAAAHGLAILLLWYQNRRRVSDA
jgi:hypothetical protein